MGTSECEKIRSIVPAAEFDIWALISFPLLNPIHSHLVSCVGELKGFYFSSFRINMLSSFELAMRNKK